MAGPTFQEWLDAEVPVRARTMANSAAQACTILVDASR